MVKQQYACLCATFELALLIRPLFCLDSLEQALLDKKRNVNFLPLRCRHFFPTYENDTLLCSLEDDDDDEEEGSWNAEETKKRITLI